MSSSSKDRLSASVDADLLEAARGAVAAGRAESLSAWVNAGLRRHVEHEARLEALDSFLAEFELEHGEITADEMRQAARAARSRAVVVRPAHSKAGRRRTGAA